MLFPVFFFLFSFFPFKDKSFDVASISLKKPFSIPFLSREILKKGLEGDFEVIANSFRIFTKRAKVLSDREIKPLLFDDLKEKLLHSPKVQDPITHRLFPQSYASFAFIEALKKQQWIALLPQGIKKITFLEYPERLEDNFYDSEAFFKERITLAFTAPYSNPWTIKRLEKQNIPFIRLPSLSSFDQVKKALNLVGQSLNEKRRSERIALFLEGAKRALKNEYALRKKQKVLFLHTSFRFALPHEGTLSYERLLEYDLYHETPGKELSFEEITSIDPDVLIISTHRPKDLSTKKSVLSRLKNLRALEEGSVFFVDDTLHQFPSQHALLAELELVEALLGALM